MKLEKFYTIDEMAVICDTSYKTLVKRINYLGLKHCGKAGRKYLYSQKALEAISEINSVKIIPVPVYVSQTFYIYESKMNFENN